VCAALLEPDAAPFHDHLRPAPDDLIGAPPLVADHAAMFNGSADDTDLVAIGAADDSPQSRRAARRANRT
jgi:hypothetical protein